MKAENALPGISPCIVQKQAMYALFPSHTSRAILAKFGLGATIRSSVQLKNISAIPPVTTPTACTVHTNKNRKKIKFISAPCLSEPKKHKEQCLKNAQMNRPNLNVVTVKENADIDYHIV